MIRNFVDEFERYRVIGLKALDQVADESINRVVWPEGNSVAVIVRHVGGNLASRFTDFLHSDGEKPARNRDAEFEPKHYTRDEMLEWWDKGWKTVRNQLSALTDNDLGRTITIRGKTLTVHEALVRSVAHTAYHVGQIVLLARILNKGEWNWITIPRGKSVEYNQSPSKEKRP